MTELRVVPSSEPVLQYDMEHPERLSRGLIFVKWLLAIPHLIVLGALGYAVAVTTVISWFAILFTGSYPKGLFKFALMFLRWQARVNAYFMLMRDEYPPFGEGSYPVSLELDYPERLSRWKIFFKSIFIIPHLIVIYIMFIAASVVTLIAWFAILITGKYPPGMFNFVAGVFRWWYRVFAYMYLLTDAYPPFSTAPVESPGAGFAAGTA
jgi:hypothetical protein